jgi:hypothetical protein
MSHVILKENSIAKAQTPLVIGGAFAGSRHRLERNPAGGVGDKVI